MRYDVREHISSRLRGGTGGMRMCFMAWRGGDGGRPCVPTARSCCCFPLVSTAALVTKATIVPEQWDWIYSLRTLRG